MHTGVFRGVHLPCYRGGYVTLVRASVLKQTDGRLTRSDPLSYAYASKTLLCYGVIKSPKVNEK